MLNIDIIKNRFGNEMAAIILSCRVFFETAGLRELEDFVEVNVIKWPDFLQLAAAHSVRPVVYKVIYKLALPDDIKAIIRAERADITRLNFKQAIETERIILLLKDYGIDAIPYKGIAYSKQFFGDLISRESSDIDLVIAPEFLNKAAQILKDDGYVAELEDILQYLGERYCAYYKDFNLNKFKTDIREFHVELHWAVAEKHMNVSPQINAFALQGYQEFEFAKAKVKGMMMEDHFSALLIHHAVKDTFKHLKNVVDIGQGMRQAEIENYYPRLSEIFIKFGLKTPLALSNVLCHELIGVSLNLPEGVQAPGQLTNYFTNQVCAKQIINITLKKEMLLLYRNRGDLEDSAFNKLKFYWVCFKYRFIPGQNDFRFVFLPKPLFFLYYLIKPFRTLIKPMDPLEEKKKLIPINA